MALQNISLSISISIIFLCLVSGHFTSLHVDPHHNNHVQAYGYGFQADPSHISTTIEDKNEFENSINHENGIFVVRKFGKEGRVLASAKTVSVDAFGAKGDGSDATEAFKKAWSEACSSVGAVLLVAQKSYLLKPITFTGPCKSVLTMQISGTIEASGSRSDYNSDRRHWLLFDNVQNLVVEGGGTINGNGMIWWQNSCKINKALACTDAPTALTFYKSENIKVNNLKIKNAQQIHVSFEGCVNVQASNLVVSSPEKSPNTDGIHVTNTQNIQISSCIIGTGDDCISIVSGSQKVQATDITCGPGHGISIGSLGSGKSEAHVSDVVVNGAKLSGTTNGVRIKTWQHACMHVRNSRIASLTAGLVPINICSPSLHAAPMIRSVGALDHPHPKLTEGLCVTSSSPKCSSFQRKDTRRKLRVGPSSFGKATLNLRKGAVFRSSAAAISLSMASKSSRGSFALSEPEATLALGKALGIDFGGKDEEVLSKLKQLEAIDLEKATKSEKLPTCRFNHGI